MNPTASLYRCRRLSALVAICVALFCMPNFVLGQIQVVVRSGDDAPDGNGDLGFLNAPSINNLGQLAFVSELTGTSGGSTDNLALLRRETSGTLTSIARRGVMFNGKPINAFDPTAPFIDGDGTVASIMTTGPPTSTWYVYGSGGPLASLYTAGMTSPSGAALALTGVTSAAINDAGVTAYRATFGSENGIYQRTDAGVHSVRLLRGAAAPLGGTVFQPGAQPTINETGQIGTILTINPGGGGGLLHSAARLDGTTINELVRQGTALPGGITLGSFLSSVGFVNSAGQVAFAANYTQATVTRQGAFLAGDATTNLVGPGILPGSTTATNNLEIFGVSDTGRVGIVTEFLGGLDPKSGVYLTGPGGPTMVAFEDSSTPVSGKYFRRFLGESAVINEAGQLAFRAELSDAPDGGISGYGVFFFDPEDGLRQVARTGTVLEDSTITNVFFNGMTNGSSNVLTDTSLSGLNASGKVAFSYTLANGKSGIGIWTQPPVIPGDFDNSDTVDMADYVLWRDTLNQTGANLPADGDKNGTVGPEDYLIWRSHFGQTPPAAAMILAIPEPHTWIMLICGVTIAASRRGRR